MYKLSYYRFAEVMMGPNMPTGYDRTRNTEIGVKDIRLTHLEEAFTSEHWLVRIYRVKKPSNRLRVVTSKSRGSSRKSRKTLNDMRGLVGARSKIVRGEKPKRAPSSAAK